MCIRDSATWASGPAEFGYGDGGEATVNNFGPNPANKYITYYYRRAFVVSGAAQFTNLVARIVRDDGVVVYLNGTEVMRDLMPGGAITAATLASTAVALTDESTFFSYALSPSFLVEGTNVLAVEIHQVTLESSDISFNLELSGTRGTPNTPPTPTITNPPVSTNLAAPAAYVVRASASDADGSI